MPEYVIMPRCSLKEANTKYGCDGVISIFEEIEIGREGEPTPEGVVKNKHNRYYFDDIIDRPAMQFGTGPTEEDLLRILRDNPVGDKIFVHCYAGISRSSAITYMLICRDLGPGKEEEAMEKTLASAPLKGIWPSNRIVRLADSILERGGKMIKAVEDWKNGPGFNKYIENPFG